MKFVHRTTLENTIDAILNIVRAVYFTMHKD